MAYFYTSSIVEVCLKNSIKVEIAPTDLLGRRGHFSFKREKSPIRYKNMRIKGIKCFISARYSDYKGGK